MFWEIPATDVEELHPGVLVASKKSTVTRGGKESKVVPEGTPFRKEGVCNPARLFVTELHPSGAMQAPRNSFVLSKCRQRCIAVRNTSATQRVTASYTRALRIPTGRVQSVLAVKDEDTLVLAAESKFSGTQLSIRHARSPKGSGFYGDEARLGIFFHLVNHAAYRCEFSDGFGSVISQHQWSEKMDSLLLACSVYSPTIRPELKGKVVIVPGRSTKHGIIPARSNQVVIDSYSPWTEVVDAIASSAAVLGQSVEAVMLADSYGIPNAQLGEATTKEFEVHYAQMGRKGDKPLVRSLESPLSHLTFRGPHKKDRKDVQSQFPYF